MTILVIVGVAIVVLGAFILLLFPDRPGGKIGWQGAEVSSIGAGLPLIVVGIAAIAIGGNGVIGGGDDGGSLDGEGGSRMTQREQDSSSIVPTCRRRASSMSRKGRTS